MSRLAEPDRKASLLRAAMPLAARHGYQNVTRDMVAAALGTAPSLLSRHWNREDFQRALMQEAVRTANLIVLAQGLALKHPAALAAPLEMRRKAASTLVK